MAHFGQGWDTVGTRLNTGTKGAQEVHERGKAHERCTRGAREGYERCTHWHSMETAFFPRFGTIGTQLGLGRQRCTRGAREGHERSTRRAREGHERGTRDALIGTKWKRLFFIMAHLGQGWDTVEHGRQRCSRGAQEGQGAQEVHERGTRGAPEEHEKGARGAREVYSLALNENGYFSFWHTWDMVGTRASKVHKRCTRDAREGHKRCTGGAREVH